ncbi:MAG: metal ABC transporter permease [bacterium]
MGFLYDVINQTFMRNAVAAVFMSGLACGITGTFVHIKKIGIISGGIAHAVLAGVGAARFFGINPVAGAVFTAFLFAIILTLIKVEFGEAEDVVLSALWSAGMASGIVFLHFTPGYATDLMSYLFGNIMMVSQKDLFYLAMLDFFVVGIAVFFFRHLKALCFDAEHLILRGISAFVVYGVFYTLISLTVVILMQIVGLLLVIAFLTLPAAISSLYFRNISTVMLFAVIISILLMLTGLYISYFLDVPAGAVTILLTVSAYILNVFFKSDRQ